MLQIRILSLVILLLSGGLLSGQDGPAIDWKEECNLLLSELEKRHPNLYFNSDSALIRARLRAVADQADGKGVFDVAVEIQQVLACLGDAHTLINYNHRVQPERILPLAFYWFREGIYITRCPDEYGNILGGRLTHINGYPIEQVSDSLATLIPGGNPSRLLNSIPRMLGWAQLLQHFGFAGDGEVELRVEQATDSILEQRVRAGNDFDALLRLEADTPPLGYDDQRSFFRDSLFTDEGIYYIQYNRCWSREVEERMGSGAKALFMPSFREFEQKVLERANTAGIEKLVLDLRFNGGGNSIQGTRFIKKLAKTRAGKHAESYLLIGRSTFSSAVINAVDFIKSFDPRVMGENSGGKPNHYGEVKRFVLPGSALVVNVSSKYFSLLDDDPPALIPDSPCSISYSEFTKGIDPCFQSVRAAK